MKIIHLASAKSAWNGYAYYKDKRVLSYFEAGDGVYIGKVQGSGDKPYDVTVDINHPRSSKCNCPHAIGTTIICKHITALYFTVFPADAEQYNEKSHDPYIPFNYNYDCYDDYDDDYDTFRAQLPSSVVSYVNGATKQQLQADLLNLLQHIDNGLFDSFIDEKDLYLDDDYDE